MPVKTALAAETTHPTTGAVIHGVNAREPLDGETVAFIRQTLLDRKVVFLRDQNLSLAEQVRFAGYFGVNYEHPISGYPDHEWLVEQGHQTKADHWHADLSFVEDPPFGTILSLTEGPGQGGDTLFSNLEAAYNGLSEPVRQLVDGLTALHDASQFLDWAWGPHVDAERRAGIFEFAARKVAHPLVITHPETGRKTLYAVAGHPRRIKGLTREESTGILGLLAAHVDRPEYVVRWQWKPGDLVFWDNRSVLHRVSEDYGDAPRTRQRLTISAFPTATAAA